MAGTGADTNDEANGSEDEIDPELEAMLGLSQMDAEAAVAYQIVAETVLSPSLQRKLLEFAADHQRHVNEIGEFLIEQGVAPEVAMPDPETSSFATLAHAMAGLGGWSAIAALRSNEAFTNSSYGAALDLVTDTDAFVIVQRHLADEQRHARWLADNQDIDWDIVESSRAADRAGSS